MKKVKFKIVLLLVVIGFSITYLPSLASMDSVIVFNEMDHYTFKVSSPFPPEDVSISTATILEWENLITERTFGKVTFENYFSEQLGGAWEQMGLVSSGVVDFAATYCWYTPSNLPLADFVCSTAFGPMDHYIVNTVARQVYSEFPEFEQEMIDNNIKVVYKTSTNPHHMFTKEPITGIDYFKGKRIFATGRYYGRWLEAIGAIPVSAPSADLYTMLQTGVVDCAYDILDLVEMYGVIEMIPHVMYPQILTNNWNVFLINRDTLNKLPKELQELILRTGIEMELRSANEISAYWANKTLQRWEKEVPNFSYENISQKDKEYWGSICPNTMGEWANEMEELGLPGKAIMGRYTELTENLGHKWVLDWTK